MQRRDDKPEISSGAMGRHRLNGFEDCIEVGKFTGFELRIKCFPIHDDLKCATASGHQTERFDVLFQSQQFLRQTDGFGLIISNAAILDDDFYAHWQLTAVAILPS
jgi:hypothetical protein